MSNEHVSINNLGIKYGIDSVLQNLFLRVKKGEFVSIVGESGVGKTSLLNAIAGLIAFSGEIRTPKNIGFVFQNHCLFPWLNIAENISFGLEKSDDFAVQNIISLIGLNGKEKFYPQQLSGGQQQRVSIGRALAINPHLLLLDEPFASLDSFTRIKMQDWLKEILQKNKMTAILVTHDIDEAILLSDRIFVLKNGGIENEFNVPFLKPRISEIRFQQEFQNLKKQILANY